MMFGAATWGGWRYGSGRGTDDLAVVFVGTGIGGGVVIGGKLLAGYSGSSGERGHISIVYEGRKCDCSNSGCLEAYACGWVISDRAQEAVRAEPEKGQLLKSLVGGGEKITVATVNQTYHQGDLLARRLVETGRYLAAKVISVVNVFNPCRVVHGGDVVEGTPELVQMVKEFVPRMALEVSVEDLEIVEAALGGACVWKSAKG